MQLNLCSRVLPSTLVVFTLIISTSVISADDLDAIVFEGVVRDTTGALVTGAKVTVRHSASGVERSATSNSSGSYRISVSQPGDYSITIEAPGFNDESTKINAIVMGRKVVRDFSLAPAGINEQVTVVESDSPPVDTGRTVVGGTISQRELDALPVVGRDPMQLVFLLAGVSEAP